MTIEFKNPPASTGRGIAAETLIIISTLQSRPGEWAVIKTDVSPATGHLWSKRDGIEVRTSSIGKPKGKVDVYARWVGTP